MTDSAQGIAVWRDIAESRTKEARAAQATARVAIGHLQAVLNKGRTRDEQQAAATLPNRRDTMKKMSKTAAIALARTAVGRIHRRSSTDYVFYAPYYSARPDGPSTEVQSSSYPGARVRRTECVSRIALALMGITEDARYGSCYGDDGTSVEEIVTSVIATWEKNGCKRLYD